MIQKNHFNYVKTQENHVSLEFKPPYVKNQGKHLRANKDWKLLFSTPLQTDLSIKRGKYLPHQTETWPRETWQIGFATGCYKTWFKKVLTTVSQGAKMSLKFFIAYMWCVARFRTICTI